ncbi:MAG: hypothetical protein CMF49_06760 [Legionellales bacterium]|nr:hypothetical protein [Legionellales bacterium]
MSNSQKPYLKKTIPTKVLRCKRVFKFSVKPYFGAAIKPLEFALLGSPPQWLFIDSATGVLSGIAPNIVQRQKFLITVEARNNFGAVTQTFFIKVINTDFFETITEGLFHNLSLRKRTYRFPNQDETIRQHELLELIYEYIMQSDFRDEAMQRLNEKAKQLDIEAEKKLDYGKFKKIVNKTNPLYEAKLAEQLKAKHEAILEKFNNIDLRNAFRQGSQLPGTIVPHVFNELGIVNLSNHSYGASLNILDAAADRLIKLKFQNKNNTIKNAKP